MDPIFLHDAFLLDGELTFNLFGENMIIRKDLESSLIFILFLRENKIRKKTLNVISYLEKTVCRKPKLGPMVRLPIGKERW